MQTRIEPNPMTSNPSKPSTQPHKETLAVREAVEKTQYGENSEALFLTSSFVQPDSETAARRFAGEEDGDRKSTRLNSSH